MVFVISLLFIHFFIFISILPLYLLISYIYHYLLPALVHSSQLHYFRHKSLLFRSLYLMVQLYLSNLKIPIMDVNKLKSRLNVKFEPIKSQRQSLKKIEQLDAKQKKKNEQSMIGRLRSSSQVKLPSLQNRSRARLETLQDSKSYANISQIKQRAKSFKQIGIPKVKVDGKQEINNTITFLMKNQILTVPRIVALLQKNQSDQFLYMKVTGIYEFQACDERQKGNNYVTVSKNGMVQNGELITLETLARQFELCKKLRKIHYFKNYRLIKFIQKWKKANVRTRFQKNKQSLLKQLHLRDRNFIDWRIQVFNMFTIKSQGGEIQQNWIHRLCDKLSATKDSCRKKLIQICFKMLSGFQLPINQSPDLINRVLGNLSALNMTFEKKIRIQKECEKFYKLGRLLQLSAMENTADFILTHLQSLIRKVKVAKNTYMTAILDRLQKLDVKKQQYNQQRQKILSDSLVSFDIDYTLYFNQQKQQLDIRPSPSDIYESCIAQIKVFVKQVDKMGFRMIRTDEFKFVNKSNFRMGEDDDQNDEDERKFFKQFVMSMPKYERLCDQLQESLLSCQDSFKGRIALFAPFLQLYKSYVQTKNQEHEITFEEVNSQYEKMQEDLIFCQKLDEGEYFIVGFLKTNQFKKQMIGEIKRKDEKLFKRIPIQLKKKKEKIGFLLNQHLKILNGETETALSFIKVSQQTQKIEQNSLQYSSSIDQIEKVQQFYEKHTKNKLNLMQEQKKVLNQIKLKMKNFVQSRQKNFMKYRKSLQNEKVSITNKIVAYSTKDDSFYDPKSNPLAIHSKLLQITKYLRGVEKQLVELNRLESYYNLKPTSFSSLDMLIKQYENLEEIWKFSKTVDEDEQVLNRKMIKDIQDEKYIKYYDIFRKKSEKYLKDSDLCPITEQCLKKVNSMIENMETIQLINSSHLRQSDIDEINYHIDRKTDANDLGGMRCRYLYYDRFTELKIAQMKLYIAQVVFKAKKQIEITQNLVDFNQWWKGIRLECQSMEQYPLVLIFGENLKLRDQIDDYMTMLINILNNKYGSFVRNQCNQLLKKMNNLIEMLQLAQIHQQKFLHLFPILTSKYAESQLSAECKKFENILNKTMKNIRVLAKPTQNLNQGTRNILNNHIKHFDAISSVLSKFLQAKRLKFQRFYFLQDHQLLEVLVGIADEKNVFRMFEGIKGWLVSEDGIKTGVVGIGGEHLVLRGWNYKNVEPELIFKGLEQAIKSNLNSIVRNVLYQYEIQLKQLRDLYSGIPWMCLYAVELILFTKQVQINCFHDGIPLQSQQSLLREAVNHAKVKPAQYSNYITMLLHLLHFTEQMRKQDVHSIFNFQWHSFLRYYYEKDSVMMRALSNEIKWGGEYQGMWSLMVNTSDIRRAHICVLNNLQYANGVLLQGPSGTGKTESLKQLARCTAKYCVIFNCSQNVNLKTISKLLSGLCYTASWLCLDQINRLTVEAMSSIAKQIQTIRNAILAKKEIFNFMGRDIKLRQGVAIFSTMNPIYLKRAKLTENIKSYFRIITVAMPQHQVILQILLYGLKFFRANELAKKIGNAFTNLSIQLTKNAQYDFGLRAMKFLINNLSKRREESKNENEIIAKSFYDVFYFRLTPSDKPIFQKIINDIFAHIPSGINSDLIARVTTMRESPQTGIIVCGPVSTKSTLIQQYCKSFSNAEVHLYNPNSADLKYFLGQSIHGRWEEGVVQKVARASLSFPEKIQILVLDSALKSEIIENFNTLLDQSKLLSLSNGTRIKIQQNFKIVMETQHLNLTSPSTVTRCNVIYVSDNDVDTHSLIRAQLPEGLASLDAGNKIKKIYSKLTNNEIRQVGKLSRIMISGRYPKTKTDWKQSEILGLQKAVIFSARLIGLQSKVQQFIQKQNSFSVKKSPFHHILAFQRYSEGEFLQISRNYEPLIQHGSITLKTSQQIFMKWLTKKATDKQMQPILWKGNSFDGKSKGLSFCLKSLKYIKISLNKSMNSSKIAKLLLPQILDKKIQQVKQKPEMIIYIDNLHMSNQQVSQQIRFMMEHNKLFSPQARQFVFIQALAFVTETRYFQTKQFDRVIRHFSQINLPRSDQVELKNIYYEILKYNLDSTSVQATVKNLINIQSDRFCTFLASIYLKQWELFYDKKKMLGPYSMVRILQRVKHLNQTNCRQVGDFVAFMFESIRLYDKFQAKSSIYQEILLLYHEFYKGKFVKQYESYLKNDNFLFEQTQSLVESTKKQKQKKATASLAQKIISSDKSLYMSNYLIKEVETVLRILENENAHYCLSSTQGSGRKTIFKTACKSTNISYIQAPQQMQAKQIRKMYFERMKKCIEVKNKQIIILDLKYPSHKHFLEFAEQVSIGSSVMHLFQSEQTDYMFASITDFIDDYSKSSKSYEQVCQDYVYLSHQNIQFLIALPVENQYHQFLQDLPALYKRIHIRSLPEFPIQSLIQCTDNILMAKTKENQILKSSLATQNLSRVFMKFYKLFNGLSLKNKVNNIHHFNFNQFHMLKLIQLFLTLYVKSVESIKEQQDTLQKSITKISEISSILSSLKQQIVTVEPEVIKKKDRILEIVPILQEKKGKMQVIKYAVEEEKKEIQFKNSQINLISKQIEEQLTEATRLLNQAVDSIQTIKRNQLSEMKSNPNPHPLLKFTLQNVSILLGQSESMQNIRKLLSDANLLIRIKTCQPNQQNYLKAKKRIQQNSEWTMQSISKISFSARYFFRWIKSIIKYKDVQTSITKKKDYIDKLKSSLKQIQSKMNTKTIELLNKQQNSVEVEEQYTKLKKELNELEGLVSNSKKKIGNAEQIKLNLYHSSLKWDQKLKSLKQIKNNLTSYCIYLCFQFLIFPTLTNEELNEVKNDINKAFASQSIGNPKNVDTLMEMITHEDNYLSSKLTRNDLKDPKKFMLSYYFDKKPILLDPDNQASSWLIRISQLHQVVFTKKTFLGAAKTVEQALKYGKILVVLIDGQIDLFSRQILKSLSMSRSTNRYQIEYNKNTFFTNQDFKLLFCHKSKNPTISPTSSLNHQVINFQITKSSLQSHLLETILKFQKPHLSEIKQKIEQNMQKIEKKMNELEAQIIESLLNNKKNLIEDDQLISLLNQNRSKNQNLDAFKTEQKGQFIQIQMVNHQFRDVAGQAADIFGSIRDIGRINSNLIWDIQIFVRYFLEACKSSISHVLENKEEGADELIQAQNFGTYQFQQYNQSVSRPGTALSNMSLSMSGMASEENASQEEAIISTRTNNLEKEEEQKQKQKEPEVNIRGTNNNARPSKPIFDTQNVIFDENQKGYVSNQRYQKIITSLFSYFKKSFTEKQRYIWSLLLSLKSEKKDDLRALVSLLGPNKKRSIQMLLDQNMLTENIKAYFSKIQAQKIEAEALRIISQNETFSGQIAATLSNLQILMICQGLKPQYFLALTQKLIKHKKYDFILDYEQLKVSDWLSLSDNVHPILLLMGEDPIQLISEFLDRKKYKNATLVAIGQDQGKGLDQHIEKECRKEGLFIIHNFHIATVFMPYLSRLIQQFSYRPPHPNFRLILIGSLESDLPESISSMCHKFIVEQPSGLKNKMQDLYKKTETYIDHSIYSQHKLSYSLCLMHSIINEMQKYGSLCWNFPPSYSIGDFIGSIFAVKSICQKKEQLSDFQCNLDMEQVQRQLNEQRIDYAGLRYLIGETCYVGKLSDNIDRKKMRIIVNNHFKDSIMKKNYVFWQGSKLSDDPSEVKQCIQAIEQQNPKTCGLHESATPSKRLLQKIFTKISGIYSLNSIIKQFIVLPREFSPVPKITHKLPFILEQISNYNSNEAFHPRSLLLKQITQNTKIFNLKAFQNPKQLFVWVRLEVAIKANIPYDSVDLVWSALQKEGMYGIQDLVLEGGCLKNGVLVPGFQQRDITLFFMAQPRKKDKDPNKGKVSIPLYLSQQRGQSIDNYGQNTDLLTDIHLDSKQPQQSWVIKGTAFVVS